MKDNIKIINYIVFRWFDKNDMSNSRSDTYSPRKIKREMKSIKKCFRGSLAEVDAVYSEDGTLTFGRVAYFDRKNGWQIADDWQDVL